MSSCASCGNALVLDFDTEEDATAGDANEAVPDDLQLPCGCHFHWQCLLDEAAEVAVSLKCPSCQAYLPVNQPGPSTTNPIYNAPKGVTIPTRYHNEGGVEESYDILPELTEEAYLISHPEARLARAFHTMCAEGDVVGILGVIKDAGEAGGGESMPVGELLRYQDPLNSMKSGLHLAVEKNQEQVFYLLLFLASQLPTESFPADVLQSAEQIDLARRQGRGDDIRTLRDSNGETAESYALRVGGPWAALIEHRIFSRSA